MLTNLGNGEGEDHRINTLNAGYRVGEDVCITRRRFSQNGFSIIGVDASRRLVWRE